MRRSRNNGGGRGGRPPHLPLDRRSCFLTALPVFRNGTYQLSESQQIPQVDQLSRRVRVSKGPPQWDIDDSIWHKRRAVVAAVGRADLQGDAAGARELGERVHVGGRRDRRIVERAGDS